MKKIMNMLIISVLVALIFGTSAFAYSIVFGTCKFAWTDQYALEYYYLQKGSIDYTNAVHEGVGAWNSSSARVYMWETTPGGTYNIEFTSKDWGNTGWHGYCQPPLVIIVPDTSYVKINDYYNSSFTSNEAELVAHELGHSFRLGDVSDTTVLMRSSGYKGSANPEQDDIDGVNSVY